MSTRFDPMRHHRRSIRLKGHDYAAPGYYFVTMVVQDRACLFGEVADGEMRVNEAGAMVQAALDALPAHYPGVGVDAVVVMPNHVHGIVVLSRADVLVGRGDAMESTGQDTSASGVVGAIAAACPESDGVLVGVIAAGVGAGPRACPGSNGVTASQPGFPANATPTPGQPQGVAPTPMSLSDVVQRLKTLTTKRYTDGVYDRGWTPFRNRLWQRNFFEHVIRDQTSLDRHRGYIADNPRRWDEDAENPGCLSDAVAAGGHR